MEHAGTLRAWSHPLDPFLAPSNGGTRPGPLSR
jgi:hypothetical protein